MSLFVDTSVWSLALRRDRPGGAAEIAMLVHGVAVPDDLSIIGCDQTDLARLYPGPITLIDRDIEDIGRMAAQLLLERVDGQSERPAQRISFPTRLILGGSCAPVGR